MGKVRCFREQTAGGWDLGTQHPLVSISFSVPSSKLKEAACQACGFRTTVCLSILLRDVGNSQSMHTLQTGLSKCKHWVLGLKQKKKKVPKDSRMMSASVQGVDD